MASESIDCPFCSHTDFDRIGLKMHLNSGHCDAFEAIDEVAARREMYGEPSALWPSHGTDGIEEKAK